MNSNLPLSCFVASVNICNRRFIEQSTRLRPSCPLFPSQNATCLPKHRPVRYAFASATASKSEEKVSSLERRNSRQTDGIIIVAGKFDAFHRGHRELARAAAKFGAPTLLSFAGMAEALGWPPRASVVAPIERPAIMRTWSTQIGRVVSYRVLPFTEVQTLSPADFLSMIRDQLGACGIVCGPDWRFGHNASGNVEYLLKLAEDIPDFKVHIVDPVCLDGNPDDVISSSAVRAAIAAGDVDRASVLMDRPHRLIGYLAVVHSDRVECSDFVNQVPADGSYQAVVRVLGQYEPVHCFVKVERQQTSGSSDQPADFLAISDTAKVLIYDASSIYCEDCEVYIDFIHKLA